MCSKDIDLSSIIDDFFAKRECDVKDDSDPGQQEQSRRGKDGKTTVRTVVEGCGVQDGCGETGHKASRNCG